MKYIGIDLHSNRFNICLIEDNFSKNMHFSFAINDLSMEKFYDYLNPADTYVMVEASTNSFRFCQKILTKVKGLYVANTHKLKLISMVKKKTDKIDAEKLAVYLKMQVVSGEKLINPVYIPDLKIQELRALFTSHKLLRKSIAGLKNRIHSLLKQNLLPFTKVYIFGKKFRSKIMELEMPESVKFQIKILFNHIDVTEQSDKEIEERIIIESWEYREEIDILTSMRGISVKTAIALIADIAKIDRFKSSKNLTSYLRSAPSIDSSNENTKIGRTNKFGRKLSLSLLMQSMNHFRDSNPKLNSFYTKNQNHKKSKVIRVAMGRRIISEIYQMLSKKEYHYYRDEKLHAKKMEEYQLFFEEHKKIA